MKVSGVFVWVSLLLSLSLLGCSRSDAQEYGGLESPDFLACREPRPAICYDVYAPVCASVDRAGLQCGNAPCPPIMQSTYMNDCKACADPRVLGFVAGECR